MFIAAAPAYRLRLAVPLILGVRRVRIKTSDEPLPPLAFDPDLAVTHASARMSYLIGSGWWMWWYALLWLAVASFAAMTAALTRTTPNEALPAMERAFALLLLLFCMHATWRFRHR